MSLPMPAPCVRSSSKQCECQRDRDTGTTDRAQRLCGHKGAGSWTRPGAAEERSAGVAVAVVTVDNCH